MLALKQSLKALRMKDTGQTRNANGRLVVRRQTLERGQLFRYRHYE
jgi:hypothetical protein